MNLAILPVLLFIAFSLIVAVAMLLLGRMFGPHRKSPFKEMPYESGMDPIHDARRRFDIRFHLVAIAFLVFDVELLFLYPWAVASRSPEGLDRAIELGLLDGRDVVFAGVMLFILLLVLGFVYDWRKGLFHWR